MRRILLIFSIGLCMMLPVTAGACTRVLWSSEGEPVITGRNMDWFEKMDTRLRIMPRGIQRKGLAGKNSLIWKSKYASVVATVWDEVSCDGLNEKGLVANMLYLAETGFGERDPARGALSVSLWAQYYLDNFATVREAVEATREDNFQVLPVYIMHKGDKVKSPVHLSLSDAKGDSAIIEIIGGETVIHHDESFTVMTNSPPYEKQLAILKGYRGLGGQKPLPGSSSSIDRFVRAAYYLKKLPEKPENYRQAVAGVLSVMRNAATPIGVADPDKPNISSTLWTSVSDSTDSTYYFEFTRLPNIVWVRLDEAGVLAGDPESELDLTADPTLNGDVTARFRKTDPLAFAPAGSLGGPAE
ncbi:MAG: linear amide C-N hydrolase [Candidatus Omnitrophica bacterium]|nr:linear amide C-N hydrolase [Candidatus Omnitrophota bacterium]